MENYRFPILSKDKENFAKISKVNLLEFYPL